ncbi:hypothetical protein PTKIN_Ptkin12aG0140100 [Pterospermum kingtungense]
MKNLLELDGFAWDDACQMVTADDGVWQEYIKGHTDARQFMSRPVPYYKDLCLICSDPDLVESGCLSLQCLEPENGVQEMKPSRAAKSSHSPGASFSSEDEIGNVLEQVHAAIQALPDMDEDLILDACDFLEDDVKAKTFMALDVKLRKKWLLRKLLSQQRV